MARSGNSNYLNVRQLSKVMTVDKRRKKERKEERKEREDESARENEVPGLPPRHCITSHRVEQISLIHIKLESHHSCSQGSILSS